MKLEKTARWLPISLLLWLFILSTLSFKNYAAEFHLDNDYVRLQLPKSWQMLESREVDGWKEFRIFDETTGLIDLSISRKLSPKQFSYAQRSINSRLNNDAPEIGLKFINSEVFDAEHLGLINESVFHSIDGKVTVVSYELYHERIIAQFTFSLLGLKSETNLVRSLLIRSFHWK